MDWVEGVKLAGEFVGTAFAAYAARGALLGGKASADLNAKLAEMQKDLMTLKGDVSDLKTGLAQVRGAFAHYVRVAEFKNYLKGVSSANDAKNEEEPGE